MGSSVAFVRLVAFRPRSPEPNAPLLAAFRKGLSEAGFVECPGCPLSKIRWRKRLKLD
jgi:hypothetical protein